MGTYNITVEEFVDKFEELLKTFEGDVTADCIAESWNLLCEKHGWNDQLIVNTVWE